jgi:uncharacterized protein (TIRG00374 family)
MIDSENKSFFSLPSILARILSSVWLRICVAAAIIFFLAYSNRLDWRQILSIFPTRWPWLAGAFVLMLPPFLIVSYRFELVLLSQGLKVPFSLATRWTMIGAFFDLVMPSSNGGDAVKASYVVSYIGAGYRTRGIMAVAFDRVIGLLGLFLLASISGLLGWKAIEDLPSRPTVVFMALITSLGVLAFLRLAGSRRLYHHPSLDRLLNRYAWGSYVRKLVATFNALRERPALLVSTLGLSILNHIFWCAALFCIAEAMGHHVDLVKGFLVFPLALFSNVFGIAGGFGVGTAGFALFFSKLLNIDNGAVIGLIFQSLCALCRLLGLPFYLTLPYKGKLQILGPSDPELGSDEYKATVSVR